MFRCKRSRFIDECIIFLLPIKFTRLHALKIMYFLFFSIDTLLYFYPALISLSADCVTEAIAFPSAFAI